MIIYSILEHTIVVQYFLRYFYYVISFSWDFKITFSQKLWITLLAKITGKNKFHIVVNYENWNE